MAIIIILLRQLLLSLLVSAAVTSSRERLTGSANSASFVPSYDFSSFPPPFTPAPANPYFSSLYDLSKVPTDPALIASPPNSAGIVKCPAPGSCHWGCTGCTQPTDVIRCPNNQDWGFSFDDGPSQYTPPLLDWLDEKKVKASFCLVGSQLITYPQTMLREYQDGHQVIIHTWSHRALTSMTNDVIVAELEWTARAIEQVIGVRPKYFRAPYGDIDDRVRAVAAAMGLTPIIWSYDTSDWSLYQNVGTNPSFSSSSNSIKRRNNDGGAVTSTVDISTSTTQTVQAPMTTQPPPPPPPPMTTQVTVTTSTTTLYANVPGPMVTMAAQRANAWSQYPNGIISLEHDLFFGTASQGSLVGAALLSSGMYVMPISQCLGDSWPYMVAQTGGNGTARLPLVTTTTTASSATSVSVTSSALKATNTASGVTQASASTSAGWSNNNPIGMSSLLGMVVVILAFSLGDW